MMTLPFASTFLPHRAAADRRTGARLAASMGVLLLAACGTTTAASSPSAAGGGSSSPSASAAAVTGAVAASDPTGPVTEAKFIYKAGDNACAGGIDGKDYTACADTPDLAKALTKFANVNNDNPWCRCQMTFSPISWERDDTQLPSQFGGDSSHAAVIVHMGLHHSVGVDTDELMVVIVSKVAGSWLVSDTYCEHPINLMTSATPTGCFTETPGAASTP